MTITEFLTLMSEKIAEKNDRGARIITEAEVLELICNGNTVVGCECRKAGRICKELGPGSSTQTSSQTPCWLLFVATCYTCPPPMASTAQVMPSRWARPLGHHLWILSGCRFIPQAW